MNTTCPHCQRVCKTVQGLAGHLQLKHGEGAAVERSGERSRSSEPGPTVVLAPTAPAEQGHELHPGFTEAEWRIRKRSIIAAAFEDREAVQQAATELGLIPREIGTPERQQNGNGSRPALAPSRQSRLRRAAEDIPPE